MDKYTLHILKDRFYTYKKSYQYVASLKQQGIPLRHQNPPEDITENIVKFILLHHENHKCLWKWKGDLYSETTNMILEVKSFTSDGPIQFSPKSNFGTIYFLDLRNWLKNNIVLWKLTLSSQSLEFKNIKVNKTQTLEEQCNQGRRPRISWKSLYPQIQNHCLEIYNGTFEDIFHDEHYTI